MFGLLRGMAGFCIPMGKRAAGLDWSSLGNRMHQLNIWIMVRPRFWHYWTFRASYQVAPSFSDTNRINSCCKANNT